MNNHVTSAKQENSRRTMAGSISCGEAVIKLLAQYGVDTVFGIPGVHTLDFCKGLANGPIRHIQARNEQGAGFMADGYARTTGKPGVALVISGPGVTNASTAIGQAFADSVPVLLISSDTASHSHGKGWGCLHEVTDLNALMSPLTAFSAKANTPEDLPELLGQAFSLFASGRPRPVHISIPIDVLAGVVKREWETIKIPARPVPDSLALERAAALLSRARNPVIMTGGGAVDAAVELTELAERLHAVVVCSTAGKGIVADTHALSLGASSVRPEVQDFLTTADVILAVGTEISETDSFVEKLDLNASLIRVDIDPGKMNDLYPAEVGLTGDAKKVCASLAHLLKAFKSPLDRSQSEKKVSSIKARIMDNLSVSEQQHYRLSSLLRDITHDDTVFMGDICQLVYTGAFTMPMKQPRKWHYPAGFCTFGCGLPNAIGAKLARPGTDIVVLAGDGGVMFTVQELVTAAELQLPLPVVIWENGGLKQIQDDMKARNIPLVGVEGMNPDFVQLALACGCKGQRVSSASEFTAAIKDAFNADKPSVICVKENEPWLRSNK